MRKLAALAIAAGLTLAPLGGALGGIAVPPPAMTPAGSASVLPGAIFVGGAFLATISVFVCSQFVPSVTKKEMTSEQALTAVVLPFSCLWLPPNKDKNGKK